jgi:hypothetical protein
MNDADLDRLIVGALAVDVDAAAYERARQRAHAVVYELADRPRRHAVRPARSTRSIRARRVVLVVLALLLLVAAAVAASPDLRSRILGSSEPAADRMESFRKRQPRQAVELPALAERELAATVALAERRATGGDPSAVVLDDVRFLMDDEVNGVRIGMWGSRTSNDRACYVLVAAAAGQPFPESGSRSTCIEFAAGWPIGESHGTLKGRWWAAFGGIADGVAGVNLVMSDGTTSAAVTRGNAFAWVDDVDHRPVAIEAVLVDDTTVRRDLGEVADR